MEVNKYFRNMGIFKKMCEVLINFINQDQHIVTSKETYMGESIKVVETLRNILIQNGFSNSVYENDYGELYYELYETICR